MENEEITIYTLLDKLKEDEYREGVKDGRTVQRNIIRNYLIKISQYPTCYSLESTEDNLLLETHNFVDNICTDCGENNNPF